MTAPIQHPISGEGVNIAVGGYAYTRDGNKHLVREALPEGRFLVSPMLVVETYEGDEEYPADTATIKSAGELSRKAPIAVVDADVADKRGVLADLRANIDAARREIASVEREKTDALARLAKFPKFSRLLDYLEGKITHFVVSEYQHAAVIKTWDEFAVYRENGRDKGLKLLTLFGHSNGDTEWKLNYYYDGSGSNSVCQPCTSEEEARQVVGDWLEAAWTEFKPSHPWFLDGAIKSADLYGFEVPAEIRAASIAHADEAHQRTIAKMEADLEDVRARYAAATAARQQGEGK